MSANIEAVTAPIVVSEGPYWSVQQQTLYYAGIFDGSIHSYNTVTKEHHSMKLGDGKCVSLVVEVEGQKNKFVVTITNDIAVVTWDGVSSEPSSVEVIATIEGKEQNVRINDGKVDPAGRLWAGTMGPTKKEIFDLDEFEIQYEREKAGLFRLNKDRTVSKQREKVSMSNGIVWSVNNKKMYYIDTLESRIFSYDYDINTGSIGNEKTLVNYKENNINGYPDGMTIDEDGKLWVACFNGGQVLRIDPDSGKVVYTLKMPVPQITSVTFGGPNMDELYVTSAKVFYTKEQIEKYPQAGSVFRVTNLGVKGIPNLPIKL